MHVRGLQYLPEVGAFHRAVPVTQQKKKGFPYFPINTPGNHSAHKAECVHVPGCVVATLRAVSPFPTDPGVRAGYT